MKPGRMLLATALAVTALASSAQNALGHTGSDHRTNLSTWLIGGSVPSAWTDALVNGALVWDNVPAQCHDFVRVTSNAQISVQRAYIDGRDGTHAFTDGNYHNYVQYDSGEQWHLNINVLPGGSSLDLWSVSAHENGHTLFLTHSGSVYDTMTPVINYGTSFARTLETYDRQREQTLYPTGSC